MNAHHVMRRIIPSDTYLEQGDELPVEIRQRLQEKLLFLSMNPKRCKRLRHPLPLFIIKFSFQREEKRLVVLLDDAVRPLFILDRKHNYKDLEKELDRLGY